MENNNDLTDIFPYSLVRIAGEPLETIGQLNMDRSANIINQIFELSSKLEILRSNICDQLYNLISKINDKKVQNLIVNAKRDIFNQRCLNSEILELIKEYAEQSTYSDLIELNKITKQIRKLEEDFKIEYVNELRDKRLILQSLVKNENLLKGLILSSESLFKRAVNYAEKNVDLILKDEIRTEQSMIKYISRMCAKTSPFSTFTNLSLGKVNVSDQKYVNPIQNKGIKPENIKSHIRLNNALFFYLKGILFKNLNIARWFPITRNPTLKISSNEYTFLTNFDNVESFQKIGTNPVIDIMLNYTDNKEGIIFNKLSDIISSDESIETSKEEVEEYLMTLIDYGLFEFNIMVSGIDPDWDIKFVAFLKKIEKKYQLIADLTNTLANIRSIAERYGISGVELRLKLLSDAYTLFKDICYRLHEDAGLPEDERTDVNVSKKEKDKTAEEEVNDGFRNIFNTKFSFKIQQLFYEDTSVDCNISLDVKQIRNITDKFQSLINSMKLFEIHREEMMKMKHFFISKYGTEKQTDVLTFYEDFYKEFKLSEAEKKENQKKQTLEVNENQGSKGKNLDAKIENNIEEIKYIKDNKKRIDNWVKTFKDKIIQKQFFDKDALELKHSDLPNEFAELNLDHECSHALFIQLFIEYDINGNGIIKGVQNLSPPGFGKYFSRFLHLFDEKFTAELVRQNSFFNEKELFVEDTDNSHFNANIHPALMPFEVKLPGSQNNLNAEKQIPVTDIDIKYDKKSDRLMLVHKFQDKEILMFDLGFQSFLSRSKLFQLLQLFSKAKYIYPSTIMKTSNNYVLEYNKIGNITEFNEIFTRPRIVYEDVIILQRKQWILPFNTVPRKQSIEQESDYFYRINSWRKKNNIPEEVFVYITYTNFFDAELSAKLKPKKSIVSDDRKPQYINFNNSFLVSLFAKLCDKVSDAMRIEEMLPATRDLLQFADKQYVTEFIIQWKSQT